MDRPRTIRIRISPSEPFSMFYIHSIYKEPVIEEFQVEQGGDCSQGGQDEKPCGHGILWI